MIRISFLFHCQNSLPFVLDAFFTTKECEAASHPEVRYTPMCTDGASLDSELEEGEWGGRHFSGFSIQVVKDDPTYWSLVRSHRQANKLHKSVS